MLIGLLAAFLWYCADDYIAAILDNPDIGNLPFYVPFVVFTIVRWVSGSFNIRTTTKEA